MSNLAATAPVNTLPLAQLTINRDASRSVGSSSPPSLSQNHTDPPSPSSPRLLSVTGRSRTAPLRPLDTLWTATVDNPQLSERDSIFATTYLPSRYSPPSASSLTLDERQKNVVQERDASTSTDGTRNGQLTQPAPYVLHLTPPYSVPTLQRNRIAQGPRRGQYHAESSNELRYTNRQYSKTGLAEEGVGMGDNLHHGSPPGINPVSSHSETELTPSADDEEERLRYRIWREGKASIDGHLLTGRLHRRSGEIGAVHVDKKIQATLPKVDPPATAARSRKASQYLGLFKKNDTAEDGKRQVEQERERAELARNVASISRFDEIGIKSSTVLHEAKKGDGRELRPLMLSSKSQPDLYGQASVDNQSSGPSLPEVSRRPHETERHLIGSYSQSMPVNHAPVSDTSALPRRRSPTDISAPKFRHGRGQRLSDDENESEHEQIKSALYFPHRQVLPDSVPTPGTISLGHQNFALDKMLPEKVGGLSETFVEEHESRSPDEVEISLQSQNDNQCWHGDLHDAETSSGDLQTYSTAYETSNLIPEADYESGLESTHSTLDYDSSNDASIIATPPPSKIVPAYRLPFQHLQEDVVPRGAVELKPYKHQVGGHSTVYRFSRRAVCKQLNNRENVFYETVERYHPEVLEFLPR